MCDTFDALPKELSSFKDMGALLRCGICYEYLNTALITPCSHNYCSYCIRKSLLYKTQCPACFEETTEIQLRNNRVLDELTAIFTDLGDKLIKYLLNKSDVNSGPVVKIVDRTDQNRKQILDFCDRKVELESVPSTSFAKERTPVKNSEVNITPKKTVNIPTIFSPKKQQKQQPAGVVTVSCPVCSVDVPERNINLHLDACLKRSEAVPERRKFGNEKSKPLPKLVYTLLNDKSLKKKLSEHGLSTAGDRATLISRHRKFTVLYNSECDSLNPRPVSKLIQQIEKEEQEEKKLLNESPQKRFSVDRKADPKVIEAAQQQYLHQHKSSFEGLIQSIKKRGVKANLLERVTEAEKEDDPEIISVKTDSSDSSDLPTEQTHHSSDCIKEPGTVDDPEATFLKIDSDGGSDDDKTPSKTSCSPVLNTRGKLWREVQNISSTPDMFEGTGGSDDSNASISLMVFDTQESALTGMPQSTYAPDIQVHNDVSLSAEIKSSDITSDRFSLKNESKGVLINGSSQNDKPQNTYTAEAEVQNDPSVTFQGEANRHSDFQPLNFDFDIDNLLMSVENEPVLPTRRRNKRRGSVVSSSSDEIQVQRVLRKRVKR